MEADEISTPDVALPAGLPERDPFSDAFFGLVERPRWWLHALVGLGASFVPLVGPLYFVGYTMSWTRSVGWGSDELPPLTPSWNYVRQGLWNLGISLMFLLLVIVPAVLLGCPIMTLGAGFGADPGAGLAAMVWVLIVFGGGALASLGSTVGTTRAVVYQDLGAGTDLRGLRDFYRRAPRDFWSAVGVMVLGYVVLMLLELPVIVAFFALGPSSLDPSANLAAYAALQVGSMLFSLPLGFASSTLQLIQARALGRWLRAIDPATLPPLREDEQVDMAGRDPDSDFVWDEDAQTQTAVAVDEPAESAR